MTNGPGALEWTFHPAHSVPEESVRAWQRLVTSHSNDNPALDYEFAGPLVKHFGNGKELLAICRNGGDEIAAALLEPEGRGVWSVYCPGQACVGLLVLDRALPASRVISSLIPQLPGYCWLLRLPKLDPEVIPVGDIARMPTSEHSVYGTTFRVDATQAFGDYWSRRSKRLRKSMRRYFSMAARHGISIRLEIIDGRHELNAAVTRHGQLESSGWKGMAGTAICSDNVQGRFYVDLMERFSRYSGSFAAHLYFNEDLAASLLCVGKGETLIVLKTAFAEVYADFAPGRMIDYLFLDHFCGGGSFEAIEMYTKASRTDLGWATHQRDVMDYHVFRDSTFRNAYALARNIRNRVKWLNGTDVFRRWSGTPERS